MAVAEVNAVAQAFHDGVANQDAAGLASLYVEDGRFLPPNMEPCEGRSEIQAAMQQLLDMGARSLDVEPLDVREAGDMTIEYGRYTLGIEPDGGAAVSDVGNVRRRARGQVRRSVPVASASSRLGHTPANHGYEQFGASLLPFYM
jgi:uncharacterized protein (TIGR02246 family)